MSLTERFLESCVQHCNIRAGKLLVAVSGGPDSVALLHLFLEVRASLKIEPVVAHVNHLLRPESFDDEAFCEKMANMHELAFDTRQVDTRAFAAAEKMSIETAARELRYRALQEMAASHNCRDIALGHTTNDQAETVLHNLARGAGIRGLAGMRYRRDNLVRPLLKIEKRELLAYLKKKGVAFREDETNNDMNFRRNSIRHQVIPFLREILNPNISDVLLRLSEISAEAEAYLDSCARNAEKDVVKERESNKIILDIDLFSSYFSVLRKYILRNCLETLSGHTIRPDFQALIQADRLVSTGKIGKRVRFYDKWEVRIDHDGIVVWDGVKRKFEFTYEPGHALTLSQNKAFTCVKLTKEKTPDIIISSNSSVQYVDADKVAGKICVRSSKTGDRFYPLGMRGSKSISNFFTDRKVPLHKRSEIPIIACDSGILWIAGFQLDERFKITNQTSSILQLEIKDTDS